MREHPTQFIVFREIALESADNLLVGIGGRLYKNPISDAGQDDLSKATRVLDKGAKNREGTKGESDCINDRCLRWKSFQKPLRQSHIRLRVRGLVLVCVPEKVEGENGPANVLQEGIDSWLLPGVSEASSPAMHKDHRVVL
jgi:hypothetical protein